MKGNEIAEDATLAKKHNKTSAEAKNLRLERHSAAAGHHKILDSIRRAVKACGERMDNASATFVKIGEIYHVGPTVAEEAHVE